MKATWYELLEFTFGMVGGAFDQMGGDTTKAREEAGLSAGKLELLGL